MITYEYYRIFYNVALYKSFSKAAEMMGNNQPNLTRCINILEHDLGCKLFIRSNRGVTLTKEGETLFEHVRIASEQIMLAEDKLKRVRDNNAGIMKMGTSESALLPYLTKRLAKFRSIYPNQKIKISSFNTTGAIEALEKGIVDFAIVTMPAPPNINVKYEELFKYNEVMIAGKGFEKDFKKKRKLKDLKDYTFISASPKTSSYEFYQNYFLERDMVYNPEIEVPTLWQMLQMVIMDFGLAFFPEETAKIYTAREMIIKVPLDEKTPVRSLCLVTDKTKPISDITSKLVEIIKNTDI